jgi:type IV pilus assembly protein PilW
MNPRLHPRPADLASYWPQRGLSLVELMVSIALGLLVVAALLALFLNITRTNSEMAKTNSLIENGRFAMQLLQNDIAHAGFWGEHVPQFDDLTFAAVPTDVPVAVPDPCLPYSTPWAPGYINGILGIPVQVYGATPPSGLGCATALATNRQANTDVLVVRHAETCLPGVGNCEADTTGKLYFQASLCELENATPYKLATSGLTLHKRDCVGTGTPPALPITVGTSADKRKFISNIYYIRTYSVDVGDGTPTLMRSTFDLSGGTLAHQAAQELIEGIEGFRVELGIDNLSETGAAVDYTAPAAWADPTTKIIATNRGDGTPDGNFVSCTDASPCTAAQLTNVTAVKLYVLARAKERTPGYADTKTYSLGSQRICSTSSTDASCSLKVLDPGFQRHLFSTTVRLTNISGRRDTP